MQTEGYLTKNEALRLECLRLRLSIVAGCPELRSEFYEFVVDCGPERGADAANTDDRTSEVFNSSVPASSIQAAAIDIEHGVLISGEVLPRSDDLHQVKGNTFWRSAIREIRNAYTVAHDFFLSLVCASPTIARRDGPTSPSRRATGDGA